MTHLIHVDSEWGRDRVGSGQLESGSTWPVGLGLFDGVLTLSVKTGPKNVQI